MQCGPCTLTKNHFSVPVQWLDFVELTDEYAIFKVWPTEQNRIAATHLMGVPDLESRVDQGGGGQTLHVVRAVRFMQRPALMSDGSRVNSLHVCLTLWFIEWLRKKTHWTLF